MRPVPTWALWLCLIADVVVIAIDVNRGWYLLAAVQGVLAALTLALLLLRHLRLRLEGGRP